MTGREWTPLPHEQSNHDDRCESQFITGPMVWSPCGCAERAASRKATLTCECGHRVRVRLDGKVQRHSPLKGWRETPWCPRSGQAPPARQAP